MYTSSIIKEERRVCRAYEQRLIDKVLGRIVKKKKIMVTRTCNQDCHQQIYFNLPWLIEFWIWWNAPITKTYPFCVRPGIKINAKCLHVRCANIIKSDRAIHETSSKLTPMNLRSSLHDTNITHQQKLLTLHNNLFISALSLIKHHIKRVQSNEFVSS